MQKFLHQPHRNSRKRKEKSRGKEIFKKKESKIYSVVGRLQGSRRNMKKDPLFSYFSTKGPREKHPENIPWGGKKIGYLQRKFSFSIKYMKTNNIRRLRSTKPRILYPSKLPFKWEGKAKTQKVNHPQMLSERIIPGKWEYKKQKDVGYEKQWYEKNQKNLQVCLMT